MRISAFGNHAPDEILQLLKLAGIPRSAIFILPAGGQLQKRNKFEYVFVMGLADLFRQNVDSSYDSATFYVFDDPLRLYSVGIGGADFKCSDSIYLDGLALFKLDTLPSGKYYDLDSLKTFHRSIIDEAIEEVKAQKTFLNQFMTFVYSMPSATHQKPIKAIVCEWMASKESLQKLNKTLDNIQSTSPMTQKQRARLNDILSSEVTALYRLALQQGGNEDEVAKKFSVSAYELRYVRAINGAK